jgi:hypothetical protein
VCAVAKPGGPGVFRGSQLYDPSQGQGKLLSSCLEQSESSTGDLQEDILVPKPLHKVDNGATGYMQGTRLEGGANSVTLVQQA